MRDRVIIHLSAELSKEEEAEMIKNEVADVPKNNVIIIKKMDADMKVVETRFVNRNDYA